MAPHCPQPGIQSPSEADPCPFSTSATRTPFLNLFWALLHSICKCWGSVELGSVSSLPLIIHLPLSLSGGYCDLISEAPPMFWCLALNTPLAGPATSWIPTGGIPRSSDSSHLPLSPHIQSVVCPKHLSHLFTSLHLHHPSPGQAATAGCSHPQQSILHTAARGTFLK